MKRRQEKGLAVMLVIIAACLFLMVATGGPFFMPKTAGELGNELSNVMDKDIAVTDSLGMEEDAVTEDMAELTFLINNFSFERSGSQILIQVAAGLLILYLILIGPASYFYLKKIRKMERMWVILPVISLIFGCIILLMSNDFIIREPYVDIIKVITPGSGSVCYGASTSPGEDSYSLYFEDGVKSLQPWAVSNHYVINEERRSIRIYPDSAFKKDYFQFHMTEAYVSDFVHSISFEEQTGTGIIYNTTGYAFSHLLLCYEDQYCILPAMDAGDECEITEDLWKKDEYGIIGNLEEELQMQAGLSADEKEVFQLAWYQHVNSDTSQMHIAGVSKEGDSGLKEDDIDLICYTMFYR